LVVDHPDQWSIQLDALFVIFEIPGLNVKKIKKKTITVTVVVYYCMRRRSM